MPDGQLNLSPFAPHTERGTVAYDLWRQWQAFAAALTPASPTSRAGSRGDSALGFAPFIDMAEHFTAAARAYIEGSGNDSGVAAAAAAGAFNEFLREQFADFQMP